ncbi:unnamed protein product [marine sediment metagenome]|uniref:Uncharacterized protein n=1 Tax=marine sediment metagenome TaxID=412755 RepID=X0TXT8_9ZZZZ
MDEYNDIVNGRSKKIKRVKLSASKVSKLEERRAKDVLDKEKIQRKKARDFVSVQPVEYPVGSGILWAPFDDNGNEFFSRARKAKEWTALDGKAYRLKKTDIDAIVSLFEDQMEGAWRNWRTAEDIEVLDLPNV